jgi:pimeloyl-ACP methyl ester carboxylesterase
MNANASTNHSARQLLQKQLVLLVISFFATACQAGTPAPALFYADQIVDHLDNSTEARWTQRYYVWKEHFAGPGSPIFVILGGEGAIESSTGLLYPFITQHLAANFQAYVLQPEHRFYGISQPVNDSIIRQARASGLPDPRLRLLTYEQALLDAMRLLETTRDELGCSRDRFSQQYCPVITVGGSYPGFLSAMARIMYPHLVDMAYAASAPMLFYAQTVPQNAYYQHITKVAETAVPGCSNAVLSTLLDVATAFRDGVAQASDVGACTDSVPEYCRDNLETFLNETFMMVAYTFANDNMAFYPPTRPSRLHAACDMFLDESVSPMDRLRLFLVQSLGAAETSTTTTVESCFDMSHQLPTGLNATITGGDWSGIGTGQSGESWDFQTCTLCVEAISFDSTVSMFPDRPWSLDWLADHCQTRFGAAPQPDSLRQRWHIDDIVQTGATRILFTNGLNDGWSVSGIATNLSDTLLALNFPNGAHHSDLSGVGPTADDTEDIKDGFEQIRSILSTWLGDLPSRTGSYR